MKRFGQPFIIVTDKFCSYDTTLKVLGKDNRQEAGHLLNNRTENLHQPFSRKMRVMLRCRGMRSLQKFVTVIVSINDHFN